MLVCLMVFKTPVSTIFQLYYGGAVFFIISVHLAKQFQRRRFLEIDQTEKRIAYGLLPRDISFVFMSILKKSTSFSLYCKEIYPDKKNGTTII
jgi:hypothetical protein